jgi:hypothetical protein
MYDKDPIRYQKKYLSKADRADAGNEAGEANHNPLEANDSDADADADADAGADAEVPNVRKKVCVPCFCVHSRSKLS